GTHGNPLATAELKIEVTDSQDRENRATTIGFGNRINTRIEPRAHQSLDSRQRELLELGIGKINYFCHEVAAEHLIQILVSELHGDWSVCQIGIGPWSHRRDFQRGVELHAFATG